MLQSMTKPAKNIKKGQFKLIEGIFSASDAKKVLLSLFNHKIQFHKRRIFSIEERFGIKDEHSVLRISQLEQTVEEVQQMLKEAERENKQLVIRSTISVETK